MYQCITSDVATVLHGGLIESTNEWKIHSSINKFQKYLTFQAFFECIPFGSILVIYDAISFK